MAIKLDGTHKTLNWPQWPWPSIIKMRVENGRSTEAAPCEGGIVIQLSEIGNKTLKTIKWVNIYHNELRCVSTLYTILWTPDVFPCRHNSRKTLIHLRHLSLIENSFQPTTSCRGNATPSRDNTIKFPLTSVNYLEGLRDVCSRDNCSHT